MEKNEIRTVIVDYLVNDCGIEETDIANDDGNLVEEQHLDSLGIIRLISFLEQSFSVKFPSRDIRMSDLATVNSITDAVVARQAAS
jgi:acyl carrier protein